MSVSWSTFTTPDGATYRQIEISQESNWQLFERVAELLKIGLRGKWAEQLDGLDQRYWDLEASGGKLTLHLEHYLGITLYPAVGEAAENESLQLLEAAYDLLAEQDPV